MSASPIARQAVESKAIPIKRVLFSDVSELPSHYSSTPGGTLFSTTPGGSKIVYEKSVLLNLRNSPISKTPPTFEIPDSISPSSNGSPTKKNNHLPPKNRAVNGRRPSRENPIVIAHGRRPSNDNHNKSEDQFQLEL